MRSPASRKPCRYHPFLLWLFSRRRTARTHTADMRSDCSPSHRSPSSPLHSRAGRSSPLAECLWHRAGRTHCLRRVPNTLTAAGLAPNALIALGVAPNALTAAGIAPNALIALGVTPNALTAAGLAPNALSYCLRASRRTHSLPQALLRRPHLLP